MQQVNFSSINEFLDYLPEDQLQIVQHLRDIIKDTLTDVKEKLSYNVPYFYAKSRIIFIWPAAIKLGNTELDGVKLGFCEGHLINDDGYLDGQHLKQIRSKTFHSVDDIDKELIVSFLLEAWELNIR